MSEYREEDVITYLQNSLNDEFNFKNCTRVQDKMAIEGILDLYQKEKEKNKKLEEELDKYIVKMSDEEYRRLVDIIRDETNKEWKLKVIEKIEELKEILKDNLHITYNRYGKPEAMLQYCIDVLQELLEERN